MTRSAGVHCDGCGAFQTTEGARPPGWITLRLEADRISGRRLDLCSIGCVAAAVGRLLEETPGLRVLR